MSAVRYIWIDLVDFVLLSMERSSEDSVLDWRCYFLRNVGNGELSHLRIILLLKEMPKAHHRIKV